LSVPFDPSFTNAQSLTSDRQPGKEPAPEPEIDFEEPEVIDEDAEIERRRKRRAEILAKSSSATPLLLHAVGATDKTRAASPPSLHQGTSQLTESDTPQTPRTPGTPQLCESGDRPKASNGTNPHNTVSPQSPGTNDASSEGHMELTGETRLMNTHANGTLDEEDGPSAADYDPTVDMKEDERRDELRHGHVVLHGESHAVETIEQKPADSAQPAKSTAEAANGNEDEDDDFDMFAEDFDEEKFAVQPTAPPPAAETAEVDQATGKGGILEGDDKDGYYKIRIGEVMCNRYQVQATLGKGMFSGVVRAMDISTKQVVAIKMMRNNDALRKGGFTEIAILEKLNKADPENRKHIVKFERSFEFKGHLCMAFENLSLNLREVLRKFGNNVGINLQATKTYAYQIFVALAHMERCSIIHADLKPDNILVRHPQSP
jgi:serine/threonine-protein kinase PRP4